MNRPLAPDSGVAPSPSIRMGGVDGLRALAALWVVLFHDWGYSGHRNWFGPADLVLQNGQLGVSLFLVLSGFCLYVPFANGRWDRFKTIRFFWRRCRRLLPAYYLSLLVTLGLTWAAGRYLGSSAPRSAHDLLWQAVTHATLTHSLFPTTFYAMNGVYWSLGLEWQLYLLLPLLVIGVRWLGLRWTVAIALTCNITYLALLSAGVKAALVNNQFLADTVLPNQVFGRWSEFLLGMVAAEIFASGQAATWAPRLRYVAAPLALLVLILAHERWTYLVSGFVFFVLLLHVLSGRGQVAKFFSWKPLVNVGLMSYSLYLVHEPLIAMFSYVLRVKLHASSNVIFISLLAYTPVVLLAAFVLFIAVERRTLNSSGGPPPAREFLPKRIALLLDRLRGAPPLPLSRPLPNAEPG